MKSADLKDRLTAIAAEARMVSFAAMGLKVIGSISDGDMQGIIDLADRIERELTELADEVHPGEPEGDDDMNVERVEKKLREAQYFLDQMIEKENLAFSDKEPFDFNLSAFLSAMRTVDYRLRREQPRTYPTWRKAWNANLSPEDACLIKFMVDDRNEEVHASGSSRSVGTQDIEVGDTYADKSGTLYTSQAAAAHLSEQSPIPRAIIRKPTYAFTIEGTDRKATEACAEYLALLHRMVEKFKAENSESSSGTSLSRRL